MGVWCPIPIAAPSQSCGNQSNMILTPTPVDLGQETMVAMGADFGMVVGWANDFGLPRWWLVLLAGSACFFGTVFLISLYLIFLEYRCYARVPTAYRRGKPWHVWLTAIPCVHIFANFWVFPRLTRSYRDYFATTDQPDVARRLPILAYIYCICSCLLIIPGLGILSTAVALILRMVMLWKLTRLKKQIPETREDSEPTPKS